MELLHRELTEKIIRAYYNIYNGLSRIYPEFIYENAMMQELNRSRINCIRQEEYSILYKDWLAGKQRLDIFVAEQVVVEIKIKPQLNRFDQAQTMSYLKTTGQQVGLLFNFGNVNPEFNRLFFSERAPQPISSTPEQKWPDLLFPELSYEILGGLFEVHNELGPGFIHRIYARACYHEMQARGLAVTPHRDMTVFYRGKPVGEVKLGHMRIEDKIMLFPLAVREGQRLELENLRLWMESQSISLGILANFATAHLAPEFMKITEFRK